MFLATSQRARVPSEAARPRVRLQIRSRTVIPWAWATPHACLGPSEPSSGASPAGRVEIRTHRPNSFHVHEGLISHAPRVLACGRCVLATVLPATGRSTRPGHTSSASMAGRKRAFWREGPHALTPRPPPSSESRGPAPRRRRDGTERRSRRAGEIPPSTSETTRSPSAWSMSPRPVGAPARGGRLPSSDRRS